MSVGWVAVGVGVAGLAADVIGGEQQRSAANTATDAASAATRYGIDFQKEQYEKSIEMFQPFYDAGKAGISDFTNAPSGAEAPELPSTTIDFEFDPNDKMYKIRQREGEKGINRALAARGMSNSRPGINALTDFNEKLIADETDKQYGRAVDKYGRDYSKGIDEFNIENKLTQQKYGKYADIVKMGSGAASSMGQSAMQTGQDVGASYNRLADTQYKGNIAAGDASASMAENVGTAPANALASYYYGKKAGIWGN